jgi:hypothetical protein
MDSKKQSTNITSKIKIQLLDGEGHPTKYFVKDEFHTETCDL